MVETSDDRNGVVVNRPMRCRGVHAIDSTRGIPNYLVEERCSKNCSLEIHAKSEYDSASTLEPVRHILERKINFYEGGEPVVRIDS